MIVTIRTYSNSANKRHNDNCCDHRDFFLRCVTCDTYFKLYVNDQSSAVNTQTGRIEGKRKNKRLSIRNEFTFNHFSVSWPVLVLMKPFPPVGPKKGPFGVKVPRDQEPITQAPGLLSRAILKHTTHYQHYHHHHHASSSSPSSSSSSSSSYAVKTEQETPSLCFELC